MHGMTSHLKPDSPTLPESKQTQDALGRPLHDLRISLLDRCNFRCPYCMPETEFHADYEFLTRAQRLTHEEMLMVARVATGLGVSKIRLTGGEPLLDKKLPELVKGLSGLKGVDDLAHRFGFGRAGAASPAGWWPAASTAREL